MKVKKAIKESIKKTDGVYPVDFPYFIMDLCAVLIQRYPPRDIPYSRSVFGEVTDFIGWLLDQNIPTGPDAWWADRNFIAKKFDEWKEAEHGKAEEA